MQARPSRGVEATRQTVLVLVGIPGAGKTTLAGRLAQFGWQPVNQDVLGTRKKCEATCKEAVAAGRHVVIDRCNFNAQQRAVWVQLARTAGASNVRIIALQLVVPPSVCKERVRLQRQAAGRPAQADRQGGEDIVDSFASELTQVEQSEGFHEVYLLSTQEQVDAFIAYVTADAGTDGHQAATDHGGNDGTDGDSAHRAGGRAQQGTSDMQAFGPTDGNTGLASSSQQFQHGSASSSSNRPVAVIAASMAGGAGSSYDPVRVALPDGTGTAPGGSLSVQIAYVSPMQYPPGAWVAPPAAATWYAAPAGQWGHPLPYRYPGMPQGWSPQLPPITLQPAQYVQPPGGVAVPAAAIPAPIPAAVPEAVFGVAVDGPHHHQQQQQQQPPGDLRRTDSFAGSSANAGDGAEPAMQTGPSGTWRAGAAAGGAAWGQQQQPWLGAVRQQAPQARLLRAPMQQRAATYGSPIAVQEPGYWRDQRPAPSAAASRPTGSWAGPQEQWQQQQQQQQQPWQPPQGRQQQQRPASGHSAAEAAGGFSPAAGTGAWNRRTSSSNSSWGGQPPQQQQQQQQQQSPGTWLPGQPPPFQQMRQQQQQQQQQPRYGGGRPGQQPTYQPGPGGPQQDPYSADWHQQPAPAQLSQQSPIDMQSWRRTGPLPQQHRPPQQQQQHGQQQQQQGRQLQQPRPGHQEEIEQLTALFASAAPGARLDGPSSTPVDPPGDPPGNPPGAASGAGASSSGAQGSQLQSAQQGNLIILLFDLNGTLTSHTSRRRSAGRNRLRPGLEHLARLLDSFRLGIFTSSTVRTVAHVKQMIEESVGQALFEPGLIMHRDHTRPATREHKRASGKAWDTVKPLGTWFWRLQHVVLFDDDPNKAVPGEELNVVRVPCWDEDINDDLIKRLVDSVLEVFAPLGPHDDVRQHTQRLQSMLYEGANTAAAAAAAAALQHRPATDVPGGATVSRVLVVAGEPATREGHGIGQGAAGGARGDDSPPAAPAQAQMPGSMAVQQGDTAGPAAATADAPAMAAEPPTTPAGATAAAPAAVLPAGAGQQMAESTGVTAAAGVLAESGAEHAPGDTSLAVSEGELAEGLRDVALE